MRGRAPGLLRASDAAAGHIFNEGSKRLPKRKSPEDETVSGLLSQRLAAPEGVCSRGRPEELRLDYRQYPPKTQLTELLCYPSEVFEMPFQRSG